MLSLSHLESSNILGEMGYVSPIRHMNSTLFCRWIATKALPHCAYSSDVTYHQPGFESLLRSWLPGETSGLDFNSDRWQTLAIASGAGY